MTYSSVFSSLAIRDDEGRISGLIWFIPLLLCAPVIACIAPKSTAAFFIPCAVVATLWDVFTRRKRPDFDWRLWLCLCLFAAYGVLTSIWSLSAEDSIGKALKLLLMFTMLALSLPMVGRLPRKAIRRLGFYALGGVVLGAAVYGLDLMLGYPVFNAVNPDKVGNAAALKQTKPIVILTFWLFFSAIFLKKERGWIYAAGLCVPLAALVFMSESESARIYFVAALLGGGLIYFMKWRMARGLVIGGVAALTAFKPFMVLHLDKVFEWQNLKMWNAHKFMTTSVYSRLEIWHQAASRAMEKPFWGWGLDASPYLPNRQDVTDLYNEGVGRPVASLHPHSSVIQIWFELGAAGILLCLILLMFLVCRMNALRSLAAQKYALFMLPVAFLYTLSIWGIWQSWFLALLCVIGFMTALVVRYFDEEAAAPPKA